MSNTFRVAGSDLVADCSIRPGAAFVRKICVVLNMTAGMHVDVAYRQINTKCLHVYVYI